MNKDTQELVRKLRRQGAVIRQRKGGGGKLDVFGPKGHYILHTSMAAGQPQAITRRHLRKIGFDV